MNELAVRKGGCISMGFHWFVRAVDGIVKLVFYRFISDQLPSLRVDIPLSILARF